MECNEDSVQVQVAQLLLSDEDKMKQFQADICRDLEHIKEEDIWVEVWCLQVATLLDNIMVTTVCYISGC